MATSCLEGLRGQGPHAVPGMNVMIPMGGRGSRFSNEGYRLPKPIINIVGRPMIYWLLDNLKLSFGDTLWIGIQRSLNTDFAIEARVRKEYPSLDLRLVGLDFQTRGAAETLFIMLQHMTPKELRRKTISLDCDTIYFSDVLGDFRACESGYGSSFYFEDGGDKPIFSYIRFENGTKKIVDIREKEAISRHANTGAYAFPCGERLRNACQEVLDNPVGRAGEFYTSTIIEGMIRKGEKFVGIHVPEFSCVGTPAQLRSFLNLVRTGKVQPQHKARFCFDLDRTLIAVCPRAGQDIQHCRVELMERNVRLLQELKYAGHYIIVETYRERVGREDAPGDDRLAGPGELTLKSLRALGICYDEIVLGKPVADVFISGGAGDGQGDIEREVGWRLQRSGDEEGGARNADNFVAARPFNKITRLDEKHIVKSGPFEYIRGEWHFYRSIPSSLSDLFPKLLEANVNSSLAMPSITVTKIDGISFSHLVTNHCVTRGRFLRLLRGLSVIHTTRDVSRERTQATDSTLDKAAKPFTCLEDPLRFAGRRSPSPFPVAPSSEPVHRHVSPERSPEDLHPSELCANLYFKVSSRLKMNNTAYHGFEGVEVPAMSEAVLSYLQHYQDKGRCRHADFVHGDPVFSNCLLTKESKVVFVDMRGSLGDLVCTAGDVNYDLSKVYQSLCGYDFIILDKEPDATARQILEDLKENTFWPFVREHYPDTLPRDIAVLAASHFLSILPLHEHRRHRERFLTTCREILLANHLLPSVLVS